MIEILIVCLSGLGFFAGYVVGLCKGYEASEK